MVETDGARFLDLSHRTLQFTASPSYGEVTGTDQYALEPQVGAGEPVDLCSSEFRGCRPDVGLDGWPLDSSPTGEDLGSVGRPRGQTSLGWRDMLQLSGPGKAPG